MIQLNIFCHPTDIYPQRARCGRSVKDRYMATTLFGQGAPTDTWWTSHNTYSHVSVSSEMNFVAIYALES